jgi:hypothetical protein
MNIVVNSNEHVINLTNHTINNNGQTYLILYDRKYVKYDYTKPVEIRVKEYESDLVLEYDAILSTDIEKRAYISYLVDIPEDEDNLSHQNKRTNP